MSQDIEGDNPQGSQQLEERISAASGQPSDTPQEEKSSPAPKPSAEVTEEVVSSENTLQEEQVSTDSEEQEALANAKNPERTSQYIQKLKDQIAAARNSQPTPVQESKTIFDEMRPAIPAHYASVPVDVTGLSQQQVDDISSQFIDAEGNVNIEGLNRALGYANQQAQYAQQQAQQALDSVSRYEESRQLKEAYDIYPQLDPKSKKFDPDFYEMTSHKLMVENFAKRGNLTVKDAADSISKFYKRPETNLEKVKDEAVQEYKAAQAKRSQQGPVEEGRGQGRDSISDYESLRKRTRGSGSESDRATAQRLEALGM